MAAAPDSITGERLKRRGTSERSRNVRRRYMVSQVNYAGGNSYGRLLYIEVAWNELHSGYLAERSLDRAITKAASHLLPSTSPRSSGQGTTTFGFGSIIRRGAAAAIRFPLRQTDFFNYTGIIQDLYIEIASQVHVVRADICTAGIDGRLRCTIVVDNRGSETRHVWVEGTIFQADAASPNFLDSPLASSIKGAKAATDRPIRAFIVLEPKETKAVRLELAVEHPKLWSAGIRTWM